MQRSIHVYIDKIQLSGFKNIQQQPLQEALKKELRRLIDSQGLHQTLYRAADINTIAAKPIRMHAPMREKALGYKIAQSIFRGLKR